MVMVDRYLIFPPVENSRQEPAKRPKSVENQQAAQTSYSAEFTQKPYSRRESVRGEIGRRNKPQSAKTGTSHIFPLKREPVCQVNSSLTHLPNMSEPKTTSNYRDFYQDKPMTTIPSRRKLVSRNPIVSKEDNEHDKRIIILTRI
ncbi:Oidioi.mRNA.OKI2018_I69.XSR.g15807.t1.cds [Oikopleura dioica]|uniref:Oidioi.mRNA.OKI2018_I69.XSR.g15807.t1.cds n=1 Tax=Oikopleura dioica TaxID=34765 RepID=A0ABN7SDZ3_OIKDI|nr:Oidioi.mRNA.OKI2018_I69.XSR.g15807.t1.cds [Oikopleura dioica]